MLARLLSLAAALLLACASTHINANALPLKTAPRGFAETAAAASGQIARVTLDGIREKWLAAEECASGVSSYAYANPVNYHDPSGNFGISSFLAPVLNIAVRGVSMLFAVDRAIGGIMTVAETFLFLHSGQGAALIDATLKLDGAILNPTGRIHGHHTIPEYMGGRKKQKLAGLPESLHHALHSALAAQEIFANKAIAIIWKRIGHANLLGRKRSPTIDSLSKNAGGRLLITGMLRFFYDNYGLWNVGTAVPSRPRIVGSIETAFNAETPIFIGGGK